MGKSGLFIPLAFAIASGCALNDGTENEWTSLTSMNSAVEPTAASAVVATVPTVALVAPVKKFSPDDIRRMQVRLREVGFDPGPIDGSAGAKTKAALARLHAGCGQIPALLEALHDPAAAAPTLKKFIARQDILDLQNQLRAAGFNPGPADGVMGFKTKSVVSHLHYGCQNVGDFVAQFDAPNGVTSKSIAAMPERPSATQIIPAQSRGEAAKQLAASTTVRPQEEIRILQLRLRDAGYDPGPFDGVMGPKTKLALHQLQAKERAGKNKNALTASLGGQH